jgi:hypothetical protein
MLNCEIIVELVITPHKFLEAGVRNDFLRRRRCRKHSDLRAGPKVG